MAMDEEYIFCDEIAKEEPKKKKLNYFEIFMQNDNKEGGSVKKENNMSDEKIEELHSKLLDHKAAIKEIEGVVENIISEKFRTLKFSKIKLIFKMENNTVAMAIMGMILGMLATSLVSVGLSLLNGSLNIIWGVLSAAVSGLGLSFFGSLFLKEFYGKDIEKVIREEILNKEEINSENLMRLNVFFDKEDKRYISDMNERNKGIHLIEVVEILKNKKRWVQENEMLINEKMKVKYNREILESA